MASELTLRLDDAEVHTTDNWSWEQPPGPEYSTDGMFVRRDAGSTRIWTIWLDGLVGTLGVDRAARITVDGQECVGTARAEVMEKHADDRLSTRMVVVQDLDAGARGEEPSDAGGAASE